VPQQTCTERARFETLRTLEQHRWRGYLFRDQVGHCAHLLDGIQRLIDAHQLAQLLDAAQPLTQVVDHRDAARRRSIVCCQRGTTWSGCFRWKVTPEVSAA